MTNAPNLEELSKIETPKIVNNNLKWKLYGCGGCGANIVKSFINSTPYTNNVAVFDTSDSNGMADVNAFTQIEGLHGSGKFRGENVKEISSFISDYIKDNPLDDINIVTFSMSGGSGSVIGPLLIKEIIRQDKIVICLGVASDASNIDASNTLRTLKTLEVVVGKNYLPITLFDNAAGRRAVDSSILKYLQIMTTIFDMNAKEMDVMDKINFFRPQALLNVISSGLKLLNVSDKNGEWDQGCVAADDIDKLDSILIVSSDQEPVEVTTQTHVLYEGFADISPPLVMTLGYPIPTSFVDFLNKTVHGFHSTEESSSSEVSIEYDDSTTLSSGLVI